MKKLFLIIASTVVLTGISTMGFGQSNQKKVVPKDYRKSPVWIIMMNDTTANYFETIRAFREFWKDRVLPKEAGEAAEGDSFEKAVGLEDEEHDADRNKDKEHNKQADKIRKGKEPDYSAEVRAFKGWYYGIQPWVRSDGSIVGPAEQQAIIDKQQLELNTIEKANGK